MVVVREEKHDIFSWWEVDSLSREARQKTDSLARAARKYDVPDPSDRRWDSGSAGQAVQSATSWNVALTLSIQWIRQSHRKDIQMFDEVFIAMTWIARLDRAASEAARQVQDAAERGETFFAEVDGMWGRQIGTYFLLYFEVRRSLTFLFSSANNYCKHFVSLGDFACRFPLCFCLRIATTAVCTSYFPIYFGSGWIE